MLVRQALIVVSGTTPRRSQVCQAGKVSEEKRSVNQDPRVPTCEVEDVSLAKEYWLKERRVDPSRVDEIGEVAAPFVDLL